MKRLVMFVSNRNFTRATVYVPAPTDLLGFRQGGRVSEVGPADTGGGFNEMRSEFDRWLNND